jgi:chromosome segregation ATPase
LLAERNELIGEYETLKAKYDDLKDDFNEQVDEKEYYSKEYEELYEEYEEVVNSWNEKIDLDEKKKEVLVIERKEKEGLLKSQKVRLCKLQLEFNELSHELDDMKRDRDFLSAKYTRLMEQQKERSLGREVVDKRMQEVKPAVNSQERRVNEEKELKRQSIKVKKKEAQFRRMPKKAKEAYTNRDLNIFNVLQGDFS